MNTDDPGDILLIKTSSMGDVIHNLPVLSDLKARFPRARIDWVVEEGFADIPRLHPGARQVLPVAVRRWRRHPFSASVWREIWAARQRIQATDYDVVLDTQGLLKSALVARAARCAATGQRVGYSARALREPLAALAYDKRFFIAKSLHAVARNRQLAAQALGYALPDSLDYGLSALRGATGMTGARGESVVLLTASSRADKLWAEVNWINLGRALARLGLTVLLPSGSARERERAERIADKVSGAQATPPMSLADLAALLAHARFVVGVDTGLVHLAAAVQTPVLALYTASQPTLTGVLGSGWHENLGANGAPPDLQAVLKTLKPLL
ncbi:MAG: lipopolysaccharide heptosyltransferase I [Zoogloeaceae bacterium]|jgi:heptosyltransferase-1|nr:lipopolysaccharide heptosyltransferase I [Zoogloeaceae bacterium]